MTTLRIIASIALAVSIPACGKKASTSSGDSDVPRITMQELRDEMLSKSNNEASLKHFGRVVEIDGVVRRVEFFDKILRINLAPAGVSFERLDNHHKPWFFQIEDPEAAPRLSCGRRIRVRATLNSHYLRDARIVEYLEDTAYIVTMEQIVKEALDNPAAAAQKYHFRPVVLSAVMTQQDPKTGQLELYGTPGPLRETDKSVHVTAYPDATRSELYQTPPGNPITWTGTMMVQQQNGKSAYMFSQCWPVPASRK